MNSMKPICEKALGVGDAEGSVLSFSGSGGFMDGSWMVNGWLVDG